MIGMQPVGHYTDIIRMKKSARPIQMPSRSRDRVFDYDDLLEYRAVKISLYMVARVLQAS